MQLHWKRIWIQATKLTHPRAFLGGQHHQLSHAASFVLRNTCGCPETNAHVSVVLAWRGPLIKM